MDDDLNEATRKWQSLMQKRKTCALVNLKISGQVSRDSKEKRAINQMYEMYEILQWKENIKISKMFHADPVD